MSSSGSSFQVVVYRGRSGHLGKIAPLVMTISAPQQRLLYTPKFSFTWPLSGTDRDSRAASGTLAYLSPTLARTHFRELIGGIGLPPGRKNGIHPTLKCPSSPKGESFNAR